MKRLFILIILLSIFVKPICAKEESSSSPIIKENKAELIRNLKEKVAKKISQLKTNKNNVYSGEIKKINKDGIKIISVDGERDLNILTVTKYFWINTNGKQLEIPYNNLEEGDFIAAWGETDEIDSTIITQIFGKSQSFFLNGIITKVSRNGQNLTLSFEERGTPMTIIITPSTDIKIYSDTENRAEGNYDDIIANKRIIIRGYYKENLKEEIAAKRIILYLNSADNVLTTTITPNPDL